MKSGDEKEAQKIVAYIGGLRDRFNQRLIEKFGVTLAEAREIMDRDFLGPEAIEKTWRRKLDAQDIPQIPFSKEELMRAKELGQFLELRVDTDGEGKGLTMSHQNKLLRDRFLKEGAGKVLYEEKGWKKRKKFFMKDTPKLHWVLVSREVISGSTDKNAVVQTRILADYVKDKVFAGQEIPAEYAEALKEFDEQEADITGLMDTDWQECCRRLAALKLNQMCRRTPVEAMFDTETHFDNTGARLLPDMFDQTTRLSSLGRLVYFGYADSYGAGVYRWRPDDTHPGIGVVFSRSR